jgi:hypothetical protein
MTNGGRKAPREGLTEALSVDVAVAVAEPVSNTRQGMAHVLAVPIAVAGPVSSTRQGMAHVLAVPVVVAEPVSNTRQGMAHDLAVPVAVAEPVSNTQQGTPLEQGLTGFACLHIRSSVALLGGTKEGNSHVRTANSSSEWKTSF